MKYRTLLFWQCFLIAIGAACLIGLMVLDHNPAKIEPPKNKQTLTTPTDTNRETEIQATADECAPCKFKSEPFDHPIFILPNPRVLMVVLPLYPISDPLDGVKSPWGICNAAQDNYRKICHINTRKLSSLGKRIHRLLEKYKKPQNGEVK